MKSEKQKLIEKADKLISKKVRDNYNDRCVKCGGKATAVHHIESRIHMNTRFDEDNLISVCFPCHIHFFHGKPAESMRWLKDWFGVKFINRLARKSRIVYKPSIEYLKNLIEELK